MRSGPCLRPRWLLAAARLAGVGLVATGLATLAGPSCGGVPQPEPPSFDPAGVGPALGRGERELVLSLAPGTIDPPSAVLWVVGLDDTDDPQVLPVEPDGSVRAFSVRSEVARLQARDGEARSAPRDFTRALGVELVEPASPCLTVALEREVGEVRVGEAVEATLVLDNACPAPVEIADAALRRPADFAVVDAPSRIDADSDATLTVRLTPSATGLREEVLLLSITAPAPERRAITLFGRGLPP